MNTLIGLGLILFALLMPPFIVILLMLWIKFLLDKSGLIK